MLKAGGTAGVLAHYIQEALDASRDRAMASRLLRALCDFPAHAKRKAKTINDLTAEVGAEGGNSRKMLEDLARNFVSGRILAQEQSGSAAAFSLIHDYLVGAIQLATSDDSTKTEEANQLLRFYIAEERGTIPLHKLRFIRKFAERRELESPAARAVLRKSIFAPVLRWGVPAMLALIIIGAYYFKSTGGIRWKENEIGQHRENGDDDQVELEELKGAANIATLTEGKLKVWNTKTGKFVGSFDHPGNGHVASNASGRFLCMTNGDTPLPLNLIDVSNDKTIHLADNAYRISFENSEDWLIWYEETKDPRIDPYANKVTVLNLKSWARYTFASVIDLKLAAAIDRFVVIRREGKTFVGSLYELSKNTKKIDLIVDDSPWGLALNEHSLQVCVMTHPTTQKIVLSTWGLDEGQPLGTQELSYDSALRNPSVRFTKSGEHLIVNPDPLNNLGLMTILSSTNQGPKPLSPALEKPRFSLPTEDFSPFWKTEEGTAILSSTGGMKVIKGLTVGKDDSLIVSNNGDRAILWTKGVVELWDTSQGQGRPIQKLPHLTPPKSIRFTIGDTAIEVSEESGTLSFFNSTDGELLDLPHTVTGDLELYYDRDCQRVNVWDSTGRERQFTRGRYYLGGFHPSMKCD